MDLRRRPRLRVVAIVLVGAAVAAGPGWWSARVAWKLKQGKTAFAQGDFDAALKCFLAAERFDPRHARTQFLLVRTYRRLGNSAAVLERIQKARECGLPAEPFEREWILAQAQAGLLAQAEPSLKNLLTHAGEDGPEICAAFVNGYLMNYQYEKALRILGAWIGDCPRDAEPRLAQGRIAMHWENLREAEKQFRLALEFCPDYHGAASLLAQALIEQKKYDEALALLEARRLRGDVDDRERLLLADCLLNVGRHGEALQVFAEVAARSPGNCEALLGLGQGELWSRQTQAALEHLNRGLKLCPGNLDIRYARAQALSQHGDREESQSELRAVAAARAALINASVLARNLLQNPKNIDERFEIGTTHLKYGDPAEGAAWLESILQYDPHHQPTHRLLARHYSERKSEEQAARHRRALVDELAR